jgi:hypothetical protein
MKVRKEWIGSKKPATLGNLADLQEDIHVDLSEISQKMVTKNDLKDTERRMGEKFATKEDLENLEARMEAKFATKATVATILNIVKSIDKRLRAWADIPERLTKVENEVFKLKLRR